MKKQTHSRSESSATMLHELEAIEGFARERGLEREADELHAISEKLRIAAERTATAETSAERPAISLEEARRVLEELRRERESGGPRQDIQRALA